MQNPNFIDISSIPLKGNSNLSNQMKQYRLVDPKATRLIEIREPTVSERELGYEVIFVRQFINSKELAEVMCNKTNKAYFVQFTKKGAKRADMLREENLEDTSLWAQDLALNGKLYRYTAGMAKEDIQKFLKELLIVATEAEELQVLADIKENIQIDLAQANRMGMKIEEMYERYNPERLPWLEAERKAIIAVKKRRDNKDKSSL